MRLFIRIYADCLDDSAARQIEERLMLALSRFAPLARAAPCRYWKMQELYEFSFDLSPATRENFFAITGETSGGWDNGPAGEELSSVWNREQDNVFLAPEVRWAHLELHEA